METHTAESSSGRRKYTIHGEDESMLEGVMKKIESGALTTRNGGSLLHRVAASGTAADCKFFIEDMNCDINGTDNDGVTPLFRAVYERNREAAIFLLENGADVTISNTSRETPLHCAAYYGPRVIVELLILKGADLHATAIKGTPLHYAAECGNHETLEYLLDLKSDPNPTIPKLETSLCFLATVADSIKCLELLVKAGADPNRACYMTTPLRYAATASEEGIIRCLLRAGADPNIPDPAGLKPLDYAAWEGRFEVVELLFPVTSRIACYPDWSINGVMEHSNSIEGRVMFMLKEREIFRLAKEKGGEAFKRKDYLDAAHWYSRAAIADPNDAKVLSNRSLCHAMMNHGTDALKDAINCILLEPNWAKAHFREGAAWKILKNFKKAAEAFSRALALDPHNEDTIKEHRAMMAELENGSNQNVE